VNDPATPPPEAKFTEAVASHLAHDASFHINLKQDVIIITGDKLELCLQKHISCLAAKGAWITPASLFLTFIASLCASTFHDALGVKGDVWEAIFVILTIASGVWLLFSAFHAAKIKTSLEILIKEIKKVSDALSNQQQAAHTEPRIADRHTPELPVE
jgi:hypothetical protein